MKRVKNALRLLWRWTYKAVLWFLVLSVVWVLLYKWVNPPITYLQIREGRKNYAWVDIEEISKEMQLAVVASEDQHFPVHWGIDVNAVKKAVEANEKGKKTRGGSTISQQTAKNVFLWPARSWVRKGLETWFTVLIELFWSKERIMEVYLNSIEMGNQCFGVHAAAKLHFKTSAGKLTRHQAALIAGALPQPRKSNAGKPTAYLNGRAAKIEKQMRLLGGPSYLPWLAKSK